MLVIIKKMGKSRRLWQNRASQAKLLDSPKLDPTERNFFIAVLGPTGSGKSSFINSAFGTVTVDVGHTLEPCTKNIVAAKQSCPELNGANLFFIDTPGIDVDRTDGEILSMVSEWLKETYGEKVFLDGVLYLHRITDNRRFRSPHNIPFKLEQLCGRNPCEKVVISTTMWDTVSYHVGEQREMQLKETYWRKMIDLCAKVTRYSGSRESAWAVLSAFFPNIAIPPPTPPTSTLNIHPPSSPLPGPTALAYVGRRGEVVDKLSEGDIVIALVGPTGTGKSSFIKAATGYDPGIGHTLEPCTQSVKLIKVQHPAHGTSNFVFVDTPGFDDNNPCGEVFQKIRECLKLATPRGAVIRISGILYMHRISDNRMVNAPIRNLARFENLCGKNSFHKVILITSMWDDHESRAGVHIEREKELEDNYWQTMLLLNSRMKRYENSAVSAWDIIDCLL